MILGEVNQRIRNQNLDTMTTAAVVAYYSQESVARVSYAGHPPILYRRVTDTAWTFAKPPNRERKKGSNPLNIPLAVASNTLYGQLTLPLAAGDQLFVYTDGIMDAPDAKGESFGLARLKEVLDANANGSLCELKSSVLKALHQYAGEKLIHDDITMIALEIC